jgi:hypothetical protein|tara:strand:- start:13 stop:288 length:276 start_codon:yes stop_codon:yes gene_type:complete
MEDKIFKKAIETIEKFSHAFESRTDGSNHVAEYKMMITVDDGTSFIFEMEYDEEGELESNFMVLQEDEEGNRVPVSLDQEDSDEIPNMLLN